MAVEWRTRPGSSFGHRARSSRASSGLRPPSPTPRTTGAWRRNGGSARGIDSIAAGGNDPLNDAMDILQHLIIGKTKHPQTTLFQPFCPECILARPEQVNRTIDFHHNFGFRADEVRDVVPQRNLAPKFEPGRVSAPQVFPQQLLGWSGVGPHLPCSQRLLPPGDFSHFRLRHLPSAVGGSFSRPAVGPWRRCHAAVGVTDEAPRSGVPNERCGAPSPYATCPPFAPMLLGRFSPPSGRRRRACLRAGPRPRPCRPSRRRAGWPC